MTELLLVVLTLLADPPDLSVVEPVVDEDIFVRRAHLPVMFERKHLTGSCSPDSLDPSELNE